MARLLVAESTVEPNRGDVEEVFSVSEHFRDVSPDDLNDVYNRFSSLDVEATLVLPFEVFWHRLAHPSEANLVKLVFTYRHLSAYVAESDVKFTEIAVGDTVGERYRRVVADVAAEHGLEYTGTDSSASFRFVRRNVVILIKLAGIFLDKLFSAVFLSAKQTDEIVFVPSVNRLDSTLPVLQGFDSPPSVVVTLPTIYYRMTEAEQYAELAGFEPRCLNQFASLESVFEQVGDLIRIYADVIVWNSFESALSKEMNAEFGVRMPRTVSYVVADTVYDFRLLRGLLARRSIRDLLADSGCKKVVVGTLDPLGRAILVEDFEKGCMGYHIPHAIAEAPPPNPPVETNQFVSGSLDVEVYDRLVPDRLRWECIPLGRPYLASLEASVAGIDPPEETDGLSILAATQPFSADVRTEFVEQIVEGVVAAGIDAEVTIKTHPDEDADFYTDIASEYDHVSVAEADLYKHLLGADLCFTINSNVGLESIVAGTPCVCLNYWQPFHLDPSFVSFGEIPAFRSEPELFAFFEDLDEATLEEMAEVQDEFVHEKFVLDGPVGENIADYIATDAVG